jgi:hypothetical protein
MDSASNVGILAIAAACEVEPAAFVLAGTACLPLSALEQDAATRIAENRQMQRVIRRTSQIDSTGIQKKQRV